MEYHETNRTRMDLIDRYGLCVSQITADMLYLKLQYSTLSSLMASPKSNQILIDVIHTLNSMSSCNRYQFQLSKSLDHYILNLDNKSKVLKINLCDGFYSPIKYEYSKTVE